MGGTEPEPRGARSGRKIRNSAPALPAGHPALFGFLIRHNLGVRLACPGIADDIGVDAAGTLDFAALAFGFAHWSSLLYTIHRIGGAKKILHTSE